MKVGMFCCLCIDIFFSTSNNYQNTETLTLAAALYGTRTRHLVGLNLSVKTVDFHEIGHK